MNLAAACNAWAEPNLDALLADPLIREVMASDRVTETDLILLIRGVARKRSALPALSADRGQAKPGE
jgi:hypothetical protein